METSFKKENHLGKFLIDWIIRFIEVELHYVLSRATRYLKEKLKTSCWSYKIFKNRNQIKTIILK